MNGITLLSTIYDSVYEYHRRSVPLQIRGVMPLTLEQVTDVLRHVSTIEAVNVLCVVDRNTRKDLAQSKFSSNVDGFGLRITVTLKKFRKERLGEAEDMSVAVATTSIQHNGTEKNYHCSPLVYCSRVPGFSQNKR
ncbi:hypothetical protein RB195_009701 [Necator americanus]|uniref:F-box domain-containing protein n=1 Tax=Necator americanus TaxID=51031 RepID=A0ABR1CUH9_NECAM